jgi:hypothetical protein
MKDSPDRKEAEKEWIGARKQWEAIRDDRGADEWQIKSRCTDDYGGY